MLFAKATNRILFKFLKRIREPIWQSYHSSSQIIFSYGNNLETINFAFAVYSLLHCVLLVVESGPSLFLYSIHWPQGRRQPVSIPSIAFWLVWGCIWRVSHTAYCPWPGCPSMKSLTVPDAPHGPCAIDIPVVFKKHFSLRLCKVEAERGSCICWCLECALAGIKDTGVMLTDNSCQCTAHACCHGRPLVYWVLAVLNCSPAHHHSTGYAQARGVSLLWGSVSCCRPFAWSQHWPTPGTTCRLPPSARTAGGPSKMLIS